MGSPSADRKRPDKSEHYLNRAKVAAERSTCLRRKIGAVIVRDGVEVSSGYVGSPRGTEHCIDIGRCLRKELGIPPGERYELCRSVHAEQNAIVKAAQTGAAYPALIAAGLLGGIAIGMSAWMQGKAGAGASDALAETGKGFGNYLMAIGVIETVALFVMGFIGNVVRAG